MVMCSKKKGCLFLLSLCFIAMVVIMNSMWSELQVEGCGIDNDGVRMKTSAFIVMPDNIALAGECQIQNTSDFDIVIFDSEEGFVTIKAGACTEGGRVCGFAIKGNENGWEQLQGEILVATSASGKQVAYKVNKLGTRYWYKETWSESVNDV